MYCVLDKSVPDALAPSSAKVKMTALLSGVSKGVPCETQLAFDASPRYFVFAVIPSNEVNL